jgi:hypothetical protein
MPNIDQIRAKYNEPAEMAEPRSPRRAWAAAAVLGHKSGTTLGSIFILAETKADAMAAATREAARGLPPGCGDEYALICSHATAVSPDVIRAAADELQPTEPTQAPSHG